MKVIAGRLKGITIPFANTKFNANSTPQKIKEALFSILGEDLIGKSFLDLYACSGQIGIEALSRGADPVVFNEIDPQRFYFIKSLMKKWDVNDSALLLNFHAFRCLRFLNSKDITLDYVFLDPPYAKRNGIKPYNIILNELGRYSILKCGSTIIIQHSSSNNPDGRVGDFRLIETRRYANNSLSFFAK